LPLNEKLGITQIPFFTALGTHFLEVEVVRSAAIYTS